MRGGFSKCFFVVVLFFQVLQVRLVLVKPNSCLDCEQPHNHLFIIIYLFIESSRSKAHVRDKWRSREERGQNSTKREKITETPGGGGGVGVRVRGIKQKGLWIFSGTVHYNFMFTRCKYSMSLWMDAEWASML